MLPYSIFLLLGIGAKAMFFRGTMCKSSIASCDEVPGFKNLGGSCYAAIEVKDTYENAREACKRLHPKADLASIRCEKENALVANFGKLHLEKHCNGYGYKTQHFTFLDGRMDRFQSYRSESNGEWLNGVSSSYRKWNYGEPNNGLGARPEAATAMQIKGSWSLSYWNDMHIDDKMCGAICEVIVKTSGGSCEATTLVRSP
ncbi:unnamed protein product, partial [Mesorhabditis belari]|uniref:C-type lectin domain-containing protein n=1 Tax=Mesorhabditis belari TaxID=2138241 RepID=A0AAF3F9Z1_9BILA